jgi:hypothetical protein
MKTTLILLFSLFIFEQTAIAQTINSSIQFETWPDKNHQDIRDKLSNENIQFLDGLQLISSAKDNFGGLSSIWCSENGKRILVVSDFSLAREFDKTYKSKWYEFEITYANNKTIQNLQCKREGQFLNKNNQIIDGEIESMVYNDGIFYLTFDNKKKLGNVIYSFDSTNIFSKEERFFWKATNNEIKIKEYPKEDYNEGIEAITKTEDNELLLIHERLPGRQEASSRYCWLINPKNHSYKIYDYKSKLLEIKGATTLKNGDILILEKTFNNRTTRINIIRIDKKDLNKSVLQGEVLLDTESKYLDNFEGITCFEDNGETYIMLVSDNNSDWNGQKQKTLLLLFKILS